MTELPEVRITNKAVYLDGQELPGLIAEDGVQVIPGGNKEINRLVVTFIVGSVEIEDSTR